MLTEAYLEPSRTSMMELFSLRLSHVLKTVNSIELPLGSVFSATHPFVKKLNSENFWRKSLLLTMERFFFRNSKLHNGMVSSVNKVF